MEFLMPKGFKVKLLKANVVVAMVEANAKSVKASNNKTFVFKISPPYSFCLSNNNLVGLNKKYVVQNLNKSRFLLYRIYLLLKILCYVLVKTHGKSLTEVFNFNRRSVKTVFWSSWLLSDCRNVIHVKIIEIFSRISPSQPFLPIVAVIFMLGHIEGKVQRKHR